jgi:hypothetical protein
LGFEPSNPESSDILLGAGAGTGKASGPKSKALIGLNAPLVSEDQEPLTGK